MGRRRILVGWHHLTERIARYIINDYIRIESCNGLPDCQKGFKAEEKHTWRQDVCGTAYFLWQSRLDALYVVHWCFSAGRLPAR